MLKFLRKYQKWMLAVFCVALMVAFLVPQAAQQFVPNPQTATMATTYDGQEITRTDLMRTSDDLQRLRRLNLEALPMLSLIPSTGRDLDDALQWTLIQRAADHNGIVAGDQAAFNLVASVLDADDIDALEEKAQQEMGVNAQYLIDLGKQYLKAEQYRQLVGGIEHTKPTSETDLSGSPGIRRAQAMGEAMQFIQQMVGDQQFQMQMRIAQMQGMDPNMILLNALQNQGFIDRIQGHARLSENELRDTLQNLFAQLDLTVVVMDAEDRLESVSVSEQDVQELFERYAGDAPGTGEPFGLGYQVPDRVKLEALRIPLDAAREAVAQDITPVDIRNFYDQYRSQYMELGDTGEDAEAGPKRLTAAQRDEIRQTLIQSRAQQKVVELARLVRQRLNEDARGLDDEGSYKALPDGFSPTPLVEVASEIENEHGIAPEIISVDQWVSAQDIRDSAQHTQTWVRELPTSSLRMPSDRQQGVLMERDIPQVVLGGRAGLFASFADELSNAQQQQLMTLARYIRLARPFVEADSQAASVGLQPKLPGRVMTDVTGSSYVMRITDAMPAHRAEDMDPIAEQVREDARRVKAYEALVAEKDALLREAAAESLSALMEDADAEQTMTGLTRMQLRQGQAGQIEGVSSTLPIVQQAFNKMDDLLATGGLDAAGLDAADKDSRLFAVELAADYKLAVVRLDTYRPLTRQAYQERAAESSMLMMAANTDTPQDIEPPLSLKSLMRYTQFEWAEGFSEENLSGGDEGMNDEDGGTDEDAGAEDESQ